MGTKDLRVDEDGYVWMLDTAKWRIPNPINILLPDRDTVYPVGGTKKIINKGVYFRNKNVFFFPIR